MSIPEGRAQAGQAPRIGAVLRFIDRLSDVLAVGASVALMLMVVNIVVDVIGRAFFNAPFPGTLEMTANWWMPMLTLLAFAYTERHQEHIKVSMLLDALPPRMRQIVEGSFGLVATGLLVALTYYTTQDALHGARLGLTTASTPPVAIWPFKFAAVIGVGMLCLQTAATTLRYFLRQLPKKAEIDTEADAL